MFLDVFAIIKSMIEEIGGVKLSKKYEKLIVPQRAKALWGQSGKATLL